MVTVQKSSIAKHLILEAYAELFTIEDKISFFQKKYNQSFEKFQQKLKSSDEKFETYDDYNEWKAYQNMLNHLKKKIKDLKNGDFTVA